MFFPDRITGIRPGDLVLEIGPGTNPHPRADVLLELMHEGGEDEFRRQTGYSGGTKPTEKVVLYDGIRFPFPDGAFDYAICSHVIEHVPDVPRFVSELLRVSKAGYLEYPTILYEYLYNFHVHLNFVKLRNGCLVYLPKSATSLGDFLPVQKMFYRSLELGYGHLVDSMVDKMIEGFEWHEAFSCRRAVSLEELTGDPLDLTAPASGTRSDHRPQLPSNLVSKLLARLLFFLRSKVRRD